MGSGFTPFSGFGGGENKSGLMPADAAQDESMLGDDGKPHAPPAPLSPPLLAAATTNPNAYAPINKADLVGKDITSTEEQITQSSLGGVTYSSSAAMTLDIPEPEWAAPHTTPSEIPPIKFVYNFRTRDELITGNGVKLQEGGLMNTPVGPPIGIDGLPTPSAVIPDALKDYPRYVQLCFKVSEITSPTDGPTIHLLDSSNHPENVSTTTETILRDYYGIDLNIHGPDTVTSVSSVAAELGLKKFSADMSTELDVCPERFTSIKIQDFDLVNDLTDLFDYSLSVMLPDLDTSSMSSKEKSDVMNQITPGNYTGTLISAAFEDMSNRGLKYFNQKAGVSGDSTFLLGPSLVSSVCSINDRFLADVLKISESSPMGPNAQVFQMIMPQAQTAQSQARELKDPEDFDISEYLPDYNVVMPPGNNNIISTVKNNQTGQVTLDYAGARAQVVGYKIERTAISPGGMVVGDKSGDPIYVTGRTPNLTDAYWKIKDPRITYGYSYIYTIRSIVLAAVPCVDTTSTTPVLREGYTLFLSNQSESQIIEAVDQEPPPPPQAINAWWDYDKRALTIEWAQSATLQGDVVKYLVFRRKNLLEPFQLITMYDWDDTILPEGSRPLSINLDPAPGVMKKIKTVRSEHIDYDFNNDSDYIYSIVAGDNHGLYSNYSVQVRVTFDKHKNKIRIQHISPEMAPLQYPNFFIRPDLVEGVQGKGITTDSIKDSGHSKMIVYFDPEFLSLKQYMDATSEATQPLAEEFLKLYSPANKGMYKFQMINIDRQKAKTTNVRLIDFTRLGVHGYD